MSTFGSLWKTDGFTIYKDDRPTIIVMHGDIRFARALCHILNSTDIYKFDLTDAEMDMRGVPKLDN